MTAIVRDLDALLAAAGMPRTDAEADGAGGDLVVVIPPGLSPLTAHVLRAAIAGLAIECAPGRRVNAVAPDAAADPSAVAAAFAYLATAGSTTGQILSISGRTGPVAG